MRDIVDCYTAFMHSRETPLEEGERSDLIQALVDKSAADIAANAEKAASKVNAKRLPKMSHTSLSHNRGTAAVTNTRQARP